jgi:hypothetical protein
MTIRFRTVGDATCTGAVESTASTIDEIVAEVAAARQTERGTRADDKRSETAMEDRKKEGYFFTARSCQAPHREQGEFLDRFLDLNFDGDDSDEEQPLSPEWMAEIERRIADDEAGLTQWHPLEEVLAEARESLKRPA